MRECFKCVSNKPLLLFCVLFAYSSVGAQVVLEHDKFEEQLKGAKTFTTSQLRKAYNANAIKYERDFKDKTFIVTGQVTNVRRSILKEFIVELEVPLGIGSVAVVYPKNISQAEQEYISNLKDRSGFEAFVAGRNIDSYVDVVCVNYNSQLRAVRFATKSREEISRERIGNASSFMEGFIQGMFGGD